MKKLQLSTIRQQIVACILSNLAESLLGVCFLVFFFIERSLPHSQNEAWRQMPFLFPTLFVLTYSCHHLFTGKKVLIYYASLLTMVPLILLSEHLKGFIDSPAYGFTLLLTLLLPAIHRKTTDNSSFARHCVKLALNAVFTLIISLLAVGGIAAIYYSAAYIFDWNATEDFIECVVRFVYYLFAPLLFCQLQQDNESDWETLPKTMQFVCNFILSPSIIIYTAILYIYFLTIVMHWELPKGNVAYMVMAFIAVSMLGRMLQLLISSRFYDWFYRPFGFISILPLVLFWIGTVHRISAYGLTELRVYLLAAGVLMTLAICCLHSKRLGSYRLILLISSVVIALLTYVPGITARSIGIQAQARRLEHLARQLSLWNNSTGKLADTRDFKAADDAQFDLACELSASYHYLEKEEGSDEVIARYGMNQLDALRETKEPVVFFRPDCEIDIAEYTRYVPNCRIYFPGNGKVEVKHGDRLLLEIDENTHFVPYLDEMNKWKDESLKTPEPFYLRNDSCMVVVESLVRNVDGTYSLRGYSGLMVFCK